MAETQAQEHTQDRKRDQGEGGEQRFGEDARRQLLAGLPVAEHRLTLAGIPTSVLEGGDGPPVVLLHGPMGNATHWMGLIPGLVATHHVIAPDLPGHGASDTARDDQIDVHRVMAWLGELIAHTCNTPTALVGQLLGGAIAARFAANEARCLSRLVLVDAFGLSPLPAGAGIRLRTIGISHTAD